MRAGELRDRLIIEKRTDTRSDAGDPVPSWSEYAKRWCRVIPQSGTEVYRNRQEEQTYSHRVEMRYLPGVRTKWRGLWRAGQQTTTTALSTASGTTLYVSSADEFPAAPFLAQIDSEIIKVTAGFGTTTWTVTRAQDGTTGAVHNSGAGVDLLTVLDIESAAHDRREGLTVLGCVEGEISAHV